MWDYEILDLCEPVVMILSNMYIATDYSCKYNKNEFKVLTYVYIDKMLIVC